MHEGNFVKMWLGFFKLWFFIFHCHHKNDLTIENARIKHVLEDGYQESIISKIFKRITDNHSYSDPQQQTRLKDHNFSWDQNKDVDRESRFIPWKIKESIHSMKNPNHINEISYMLPEKWISNLRQFLRKLITFVSVKLYRLIFLITLIWWTSSHPDLPAVLLPSRSTYFL